MSPADLETAGVYVDPEPGMSPCTGNKCAHLSHQSGCLGDETDAREEALRRELGVALEENRRLKEALTEALGEWSYAAGYKGEYLTEKHGDTERIHELLALFGLGGSP